MAATIAGKRIDLSDLDVNDADHGAALQILKDAMLSLATTQYVTHRLLSVSIVKLVDSIKTMCVTMGSNRIIQLWADPAFVKGCEVRDAAFGLMHEAWHLILGHLYDTPANMKDTLLRDAQEIFINHVCMVAQGRTEMPKPNGLELMDPQKFYAKYRAAKKDKGETPVDFKTFVANVPSLRGYLAEIPEDKRNSKRMRGQGCEHHQGNTGGAGQPGDGDGAPGDGDPSGSGKPGDQDGKSKGAPGINKDQLDKLVEKVLGDTVVKARNGDKTAKDAILQIGDAVGEDHRVWGDLALGALRGEASPKKKVSLWEHYLGGALRSRLEPGERARFDRAKLPFADIYWSQGAEIPLAHLGDDYVAEVAVILDTSGSMPSKAVQAVASFMGQVPNAHIRYCTFDTQVYEIEVDADTAAVRGGGGTNLGPVVEWVENDENHEHPLDCVLVVTDGYVPPVLPAEPSKWIWLVLPTGDTWMEDDGYDMTVVEFDAEGLSDQDF